MKERETKKSDNNYSHFKAPFTFSEWLTIVKIRNVGVNVCMENGKLKYNFNGKS